MKTRNNIWPIFALTCILFFTAQVFAQKITTQKDSISSFFVDAGKEIKPVNFELLDTTQQESLFSYRSKPYILLGFKPQAQNYFDPSNSKPKRTPSFIAKTVPLEDDVMVKRNFLGKDTSNNIKMKSDVSLGTFMSDGKGVKIEVRDHSLVDGDRIKVFVNEKMVNSNIMLSGTSFILNVDLEKGYNRIDIQALNQGYSGPNTAELRVFDDHGRLIAAKEWNIGTGDIATLGVIKN